MAGSRNPTVSGVSVPNSGVLPTTLALHGLQKPTLESLSTGSTSMQGINVSFEWRRVAPHVR